MKRILPRLLCCCLALLFWETGFGQFPPNAIEYTVEVYSEPSPGYIFTSPRADLPVFSLPSNLQLLDSAGTLVWYAPIADEAEPPFRTVMPTDFKPLGNKKMVFFRPGDGGGKYLILDSTFSIVDSVWCNGLAITDDHDFMVDADGNYTIICDSIIAVDASGLLTDGGVQGSSNCQALQQIVQKQDSNRNVLWNWFSLDHQPVENTDTAYFNSPSWMDHTHMNSLWEDETGAIVTSSRNLNEITRFDPITGNVLWRFGGKSNDFTLIGDTEFLSSQHDANFTEEGNLYLFDNGTEGAHHVARYVEYELDTVNWTATLVREHRHPKNMRSLFMGNAEHLPDDHVILSWGGVFPEDSTVDVAEYLPDGSLALELDLRLDYLTYRVHKNLIDWELDRPELTCDDQTKTLKAPGGFSSYWWNTGDTTQEITVSNIGTYQVWVPHGIGFMSSEPVEVTDVDLICLALETDPGRVVQTMEVGPNPTEGLLHVWLPESLRDGWIAKVYDGLGRLVHLEQSTGIEMAVDMEPLPVGVYILRIESEDSDMVYRERVMRW